MSITKSLTKSIAAAIDKADQLRDEGNLDAAITAYSEIVRTHTNLAHAHYKLGTGYMRAGRDAEAEASLRKALSIDPEYPEAANNLGILVDKRGLKDEAEALYRIAISLNTSYVEPHLNLGGLLIGERKHIEARFFLSRALELRPESAAAMAQLGSVFYETGQVTEGKALLQRAVAADPNNAHAWVWLGRCHNAFGELDAATRCARTAIALDPNQLAPWHNLLLATNWRNVALAEAYAQHLSFGDHLQQTLGLVPATEYPNPPRPQRKLRIGFVSGDLRTHSVSYFVEACLRNFNAQKFEAWAYYNHPQFDQRSAELKPLFTEWRTIVGMNDEAVAAVVRRDRIDILIDLSGHTGNSRLDVFAHRPAPVQVSWIGYPNTTGLKTIAYRITDAIADPLGESEPFYCETLVRLPDCFLCYTAPQVAPAVGPLPLQKNSIVTFGSFNGRVKITDETLALWSRILASVKDSRLLVKSVNGLADTIGKRQLIEQMVAAGIDPERVTLMAPKEATEDHLALYNAIDIALDTTPYNGTTTTCEALWMGVPVVTLCGDRHASRVGASLLKNVGLTELVAYSEADYVSLAVELASDPTRLAGLRSTMRQRLLSSPLMDQVTATRHLEKALRDMWIAHCDQHRSSPLQTPQGRGDRLEVSVNGGERVVVTSNILKSITGWILLEQEDWFEDDIRFLRKVCSEGWKALDIGANHGVYALALASAGAAKVWAFEPVSESRCMLRDSIEANHYNKRINIIPLALSHSTYTQNLSPSIHSELNALHSVSMPDARNEQVNVVALDDLIEDLGLAATRFDFVKIDVEGEECAVLRGGMRFFLEQSPLVMYDARDSVGTIQSNIGALLRAMGYGIYRLVPGILCLVPITPEEELALDPFILNLYACKPEMSATLEMRGFLATDVASSFTHPDPEAIAELFSLPAISAHSPATWRDFDFTTPFGKALLSWCKSRQNGTPPAARYGQLTQGLELVQMAVDADDNHPAVAALGLRLCSDMGLRAQSLAIAEAFLAQMGPDDEFPIDRPMPPPYEVFDQRTPLAGLGQFFYQSLIEFQLDRATHSTIFTKGASFDFGPGLANPEHSARFERTAVLNQARDFKILTLPGDAKLFYAAPDNLNSELWRQLASEGELLAVCK